MIFLLHVSFTIPHTLLSIALATTHTIVPRDGIAFLLLLLASFLLQTTIFTRFPFPLGQIFSVSISVPVTVTVSAPAAVPPAPAAVPPAPASVPPPSATVTPRPAGITPASAAVAPTPAALPWFPDHLLVESAVFDIMIINCVGHHGVPLVFHIEELLNGLCDVLALFPELSIDLVISHSTRFFATLLDTLLRVGRHLPRGFLVVLLFVLNFFLIQLAMSSIWLVHLLVRRTLPTWIAVCRDLFILLLRLSCALFLFRFGWLPWYLCGAQTLDELLLAGLLPFINGLFGSFLALHK
mmetsp:Transcript_34358/g.91934  ORF Transcript_34358/g.91934 Transcript_34358/m.91934 type:complete len:296 (+) Transcript_34358:922-1809(+)